MLPTRKTQRNNMLPLLRMWLAENFCHNDKYSRVDSFSKAKKDKVPIAEEMEGGGRRETGFKEECHEPRIWTTNGISRLHKMCVESDEWKDLDLFKTVAFILSQSLA